MLPGGWRVSRWGVQRIADSGEALRAWAEVDAAALRANWAEARRRFAGAGLMAVVKADAYGHGLERVARILGGAERPPDFYGVAGAAEARRLAALGLAGQVYLLGPTLAQEWPEIVARDWVAGISSQGEAEGLAAEARRQARVARVHLALDSGMGREGFPTEEAEEGLRGIEALPELRLEGLFSHLPSADEDEAFTLRQMARFADWLEAHGGGGRFGWRHLANSAGLLGYPAGSNNLARPGLMLYGVSPLPEWQHVVQPVMTLRARVALVRTLSAGHGISYGGDWVTPSATRLATVTIGYGDGYPRALSGRGAEVWIRGRRHPLRGRVTMDQVVVEVAGGEVCAGDEVELFGPHIPVAELARKAGMIPWEILTGILSRVPRFVKDGPV